MFHAALDSTKTWKQIVDALATMLTEAHFMVTKSKMALRQMDSSKVAMLDIELPAQVFQEYTCDAPDKSPHDVCIGIDELVRVSKRMTSEDHLEFSIDESGSTFEIRMIGNADRRFKLQLLTPPPSRAKRPALKFDVRVEMFADTFKQAVKDVGVLSGHVRITANGDTLKFSGASDFGETEVVLSRGGDESPVYVLEAKTESSAMYALNYLVEISKAIASDTVTLQFSTNNPLLLESLIAEVGRLSFILAPRIERR